MKSWAVWCLSFVLVSQWCHAEPTETSLTYFVIHEQARPLQMEPDEQGHSGIISDLLETILADTHVTLTIEHLPFRRMIRKMEQEREANWVSLGAPAWHGIQSERLSLTPILSVSHVAVLAKSSLPAIVQPSELKNRRAILLFGFDYPGLNDFMAAQNISAQYVKQYESAFRLVKRDPKHAVFIEMAYRVEYNLKQQERYNNDFYRISMSSVIPDYQVHLAYSPGLDKALADLLEQGIRKVKNMGYLDQIIARYR